MVFPLGRLVHSSIKIPARVNTVYFTSREDDCKATDIHQIMLISLFPTPFDHIHIHGSGGLILWYDLIIMCFELRGYILLTTLPNLDIFCLHEPPHFVFMKPFIRCDHQSGATNTIVRFSVGKSILLTTKISALCVEYIK